MKSVNAKHVLLLFVLYGLSLMNGCIDGSKKVKASDEKDSAPRHSRYEAAQEKVNLDTMKLLRAMQSTFSPESMLRYFGPGTHSFYIVAGKAESGNNLTFLYTKDLGVTAYFAPEMLLGNLLKTGTDNGPFNRGIVDRDMIFGSLANDKIGAPRTMCVYEICIGYDKTKKLIYPWTVKQLSVDKYRAHFDSSFSRNDFVSNGLPRTMIGGYEELSKKIHYPEEAQRVGVTGKIVVSTYVDEKGNVVGTQLLRGIGFGCDEIALSAIKRSKFYPSDYGKSEVIIPIDFALEYKSSSIDLTSTQFRYDPGVKYNNIYFNVINKGSAIPPKTKVFVSLFIDQKMVAMSIMPQIKKDASFWVRWENVKKGVHEYSLYIDPENNLKETNRTNNIITGSFEIR